MVNGRVGRRGGARGTACLDDGRTPLLDGGDELVLQPSLIVDRLGGARPAYPTVEEIRVLGGRVVAPDGHPGDVVDRHPQALGDLGQGPIVIQAHHGREPLVRNVRCTVHGDQAVGVSRITNYQHPKVVGRPVVQHPTLSGEDGAIGLEEVLTLHTRGPGPGTNQ